MLRALLLSVLVVGCNGRERKVTANDNAAPSASAVAPTTVAFNDDPVGAVSPSFEVRTGKWTVADASGARGLLVEGSVERDGMLAVARADAPARDVRVSVRFLALGGELDRAAGIAFGIAADGSYHAVRANALEGSVVYFKFANGKRKVIGQVADLPIAKDAWHTLAIELRGAHLEVFLDGERRFERALDAAPPGRMGLWSRADSKVLFDDFAIAAL